jgi:taurine dioxygenase
VGSHTDVHREALQTDRLTPALGAAVTGLDLSRDLTGDEAGAVRAALDEHLVLFFRDQDLTPHRQAALATRLGPLYVHPFYAAVDGADGIIAFEHGDARRAAQNDWHTDVTYLATPPRMSLLFGEVIPPAGGDTLWASMYAAYESLSPRMRNLLGGMHAVHDFAKDFPPSRFAAHGVAANPTDVYAANPAVTHPVVRRHPTSGRAALYVNSSFTTHIEGLPARESAALLRFLFDHVTQPELQVRWRWRAGDVALWDNYYTQHYAVSDYFPQRRRVRRATILAS